MNADTPITNARWETFCCSGQSWYQIAEEMKLDCRQLERELTVARAKIERLDTAGIHSCHKDCQRPNCVLRRELKSVTEQRDRLADALERIADYQGRFMEEYPTSIAAEALQSLNQTTP